MTVWWPPPDVPEPEPCGRTDAHDSHDWQEAEVWLYCPGSDGERPSRWRRTEQDGGIQNDAITRADWESATRPRQ